MPKRFARRVGRTFWLLRIMTSANLKSDDLRNLRLLADDIQNTLQNGSTGIFQQLPKDIRDVYYEGCYCIFAVQNPAVRTVRAVKWMRSGNIFDTAADDPDGTTKRVAEGIRGLVRFHNVKGRRVVLFRRQVEEVYGLLKKGGPVFGMRDHLARMVNGFGMKEAGHFLRNTGFRGLAILDVHILRQLDARGVFGWFKGKSLSPSKYREAEAAMQGYARELDTDVDHLDVLWWSQGSGGPGR